MNGSVFVLACSLLLAVFSPPAAGFEIVDRSIEFDSRDGVQIRGVLIVPVEPAIDGEIPPVVRRPLAVLLHGFGRDRDSLLPLADRLAEEGIASAIVDLRGHGQSRRHRSQKLYSFPVVPIGDLSKAAEDVRLLVAELESDELLDPTRIALVGVGEGALIAAEAASRLPGIDALALVDTSDTLAGMDARRSLGLYGRRPALVVCSAFPQSEERAQVLAEYGLGERAVVCVDSFAAGDRLLQDGSPATERVAAWLAEHLAVSP